MYKRQVVPFTSRAIVCTASKSPGDAAGKPASITSIPRRTRPFAISIFSGVRSATPGVCSPSRRVVSVSYTHLNIVRAPELYIDMYNYCGERCEVKLEAINLRERKIIPAIQKGETIVLDFSHAITATHSFLTALLADPIKILGLKSYKQIKIIGANETIRTIIDFVFDTYTN